MISFLFSAFVGLKSFVCNRLCFCDYSFTFLMKRDRNHTYFWKYGWYTENERWVCFFFSLSFFSSSGCITPLLCLLLLHPKKNPKLLHFFVTVAAFLTVLLRLTRPKARMTHLHIFHSLDVSLIWVTCVLKWPQSKTPSSVMPGELAANRWHKSTQTPDFGSRGQSEKSVILLK